MTGEHGHSTSPLPAPILYQIKLSGALSPDWAAWFDGMALTVDPAGDTLLTGPIVDQSALHGLLRRIRDTGLTLISLNALDCGA
jgi:hypothetical protein